MYNSVMKSSLKIGIVACGAIVREMIAIAKRQHWDFELTAVPAQLHNRPERIAAAVQRRLDEWAGCFDLILVGYGDCGTGGALDELLRRYPQVVRIPGPHCYDFYGGDAFVCHNEEHLGTFYLTDFLARHFDNLVWKGLGLERHPHLFELYFGNYTHVLYLRQLAEQDQSERAQRAAAKMGLEYVEVETGLAVLEERLLKIVEGFQLKRDSGSIHAQGLNHRHDGADQQNKRPDKGQDRHDDGGDAIADADQEARHKAMQKVSDDDRY